ncbi:hypothetical protein L1887_53638 [Cichorium endivia]|nr:hypothetical protein L1887_53638 [Cichorium endivia]
MCEAALPKARELHERLMARSKRSLIRIGARLPPRLCCSPPSACTALEWHSRSRCRLLGQKYDPGPRSNEQRGSKIGPAKSPRCFARWDALVHTPTRLDSLRSPALSPPQRQQLIGLAVCLNCT